MGGKLEIESTFDDTLLNGRQQSIKYDTQKRKKNYGIVLNWSVWTQYKNTQLLAFDKTWSQFVSQLTVNFQFDIIANINRVKYHLIYI